MTDNWSNCPPGAIVELAEDAHRQVRKKKLIAVAAGLLCVSLLAVTLIVAQRPTEAPVAISCEEVQQNYAAYQAGTLDSTLALRIRDHLASCKMCRQLLAKEARPTSGPDAATKFVSAKDARSIR